MLFTLYMALYFNTLITSIRYMPLLWVMRKLDDGDISRFVYVFVGSLESQTIIGFIAYIKGRGVTITHKNNGETVIYVTSHTTSVASDPREPIRFLAVMSYLAIKYELSINKNAVVNVSLDGFEFGRKQTYSILVNTTYNDSLSLDTYIEDVDRGLKGLLNKPIKSYQTFIEDVYGFNVTLNVSRDHDQLINNNNEANNV